MANYVLGFAFDLDGTSVALIHKSHPEWQAGRWNGIGGSVEVGEQPLAAMVREFEEETGIQTDPVQWRKVGIMRSAPREDGSRGGWLVHVYTMTEALRGRLVSRTEEHVGMFSVDPLGLVVAPGGVLENIPALIQLCRIQKDHSGCIPTFSLTYL